MTTNKANAIWQLYYRFALRPKQLANLAGHFSNDVLANHSQRGGLQMNKMLELLHSGKPWQALNAIPIKVYYPYVEPGSLASWLERDDLTTLLLLIAAAEGYEL